MRPSSDNLDLATAPSNRLTARPVLRIGDTYLPAARLDPPAAPQDHLQQRSPKLNSPTAPTATNETADSGELTLHKRTMLQDAFTSIHSLLQTINTSLQRMNSSLQRAQDLSLHALETTQRMLDKMREMEETTRRNHETLMASRAALEGALAVLAATARRARRDSGVGR